MIKVSSGGNGFQAEADLPSVIRRRKARNRKAMPLDVHDIRANNLRHLCGTQRGSQKAMADKLSMTESQLSQYIGKTRQKPIGSRLARTMERRLKLARGWMDTADHDLTPEGAAVARRFQASSAAKQQLIKDLLDLPG
jgi:DNA-binding transcriptional regulator YdaS (Cro superfamily)